MNRRIIRFWRLRRTLRNANKKWITFAKQDERSIVFADFKYFFEKKVSPMPLLVSSPMQRLDPLMKCVICGHPILWNESRVTDDGKLGHEDCLAAKLKDKDARPQTNC